jgi:glyoxylase-like metal-dependent hydrolase (beta-lactamase superfamily II)
VPERSLRVVGDRVLDVDAFPTPGHAVHHVTYVGPDGSGYAGDAAGARIAPDRLVLPVTPPPDVDLAAFESSLAAIEERRPERLCLPHFGLSTGLEEHVARHREVLARWAERVERGLGEDEFAAAAEREIADETDPETAECLASCASPRLSYLGLVRHRDTTDERKGD